MISFRPTSSLREMVYAKSTVTIIPKAVPIKVTKIEFRKDFEITVPCLIRNSYASKLHFWGKYVYPYKFKTSLSVKDATAIKTTGAMHINEKVALNGVNLNLNPGDFVTIIGGNGAGKSTTLNAIAGVWPIDSGKIIIDGTDITSLPEHKRAKYLGRVFQDPMTGTAATMDIEENMAIALRRGEKRTLRWGVSREDRELFREKLQTLGLGLEDRMTSKVGLLSGGQRQAITLLMAALKQPKLLLLDEHTAALDPKTAAKVLEISDKIIAENQLTAMMVTHNMKDAIVHGNRLIMMHEGKVIYDVAGEEKKNLQVKDLLAKFEEVSGGEFANDRMMLA